MFDSCREQMSLQKHYDFGLRALKSVLAAAGIIRRGLSANDSVALMDADEEQIVSNAFKGSVLPKLLKDDAAIMQSLLAQVFTLSSSSSSADSKFDDAFVRACQNLHLSPSPQWAQKVLQIKQLARSARPVSCLC